MEAQEYRYEIYRKSNTRKVVFVAYARVALEAIYDAEEETGIPANELTALAVPGPDCDRIA